MYSNFCMQEGRRAVRNNGIISYACLWNSHILGIHLREVFQSPDFLSKSHDVLHTECAFIILQLKLYLCLQAEWSPLCISRSSSSQPFWKLFNLLSLQSFTRNYFIFMVRTLQGRTPNTVILLELKLNVRTKMIFRVM